MAPSTRRTSGAPERALSELLDGTRGAVLEGIRVRRVTTDSREVQPGDLFVAVVGTESDGHEHLAEAVSRGAVAVLVEREVPPPGVPVITVENTRREVARIAARWYGEPARGLPFVGITGTLGKTTVMSMFEAILLADGRRLGTIGSLGVRMGGEEEATGYTAPDPMILHAALGEIADAGAELVAMEVTTHALTQERVHGLVYDLGVFTNLVPLEHVDYHGSFRRYLQAKTRYFEHLRPGAPLVYSHDDRGVRGVVRRYDVQPVGVGQAPAADVRYEIQEMTAEGSRFTLRAERPLPRPGGGEREPFALTLQLRTLGRSTVVNAALAATAALLVGASEEAVRTALERFPAPRRRMQVVRTEPFLVLDDTAGHPDSIGVAFEVVQRLRPERVHAVVAIRGKRGAKINRRLAEALGIWAAETELQTLIVTSSRGFADPLNTVSRRERTAFLGALEKSGTPFEERERLDGAIDLLLERAGTGDLVLLIGAQGMDEGARLLEERLGATLARGS